MSGFGREENGGRNGSSPTSAKPADDEQQQVTREASPAQITRDLVRKGVKAALATLEAGSGHPYVSLVTVATTMDGTPLVLISNLALHTKNAQKDPRASILFDGTSLEGDPLAGGRVSVMGELQKIVDQSEVNAAASRFLARHPAAEMYAGFADFAFFRLNVKRAHFIGGFGRIVDLKADDLLLDLTEASQLREAESDIVEHMNADHADALELYASELLRLPAGPGRWRMTGMDPEGLDMIRDGFAARLVFPERVYTAQGARAVFKHLAYKARGNA